MDFGGEPGQLGVMARDDQRRVEGGAREFERHEDRRGSFRVQCRGRFVRQDHLGTVRESPGDGDPLALPDGNFVRSAGRESNEFERLEEICDAVVRRSAREAQRQGHVLFDGQVVDQVVRLEHEADVMEADLRERRFLEAGDLTPSQYHRAFRRDIESAEDREERGLAASVSAPDEDRLPGPRLQVHVSKDNRSSVVGFPYSGCR